MISDLSSRLIACICEGGAETAIVDILLNNDCLVFDREQLIDERVIPRLPVKSFERRYLRREYDKRITILRMIDSRSEQFNLSKPYSCQIDVINIITAPEIEILVIVSQGKFDDYCRSGIKKPSEYCKVRLGIKDVKKPLFVSEYFSDADYLIDCIKEYHRVHKSKNNELSLYDLIKDELKNKRKLSKDNK